MKRNRSIATQLCLAALLALTLPFIGCGHNDDSAPALVSGKVVMGQVKGAVVWADHSGGSALADGNLSGADELATSTTTDSNGNFTLPVNPGYAYILRSFGGTDILTNQPAIPMSAPAGARNITALTTLVAEQPAMQAAIENLGVSYDQDISQSVTPAALLLVQSIQTAVSTLTNALDPGANKLTSDQSSAIQKTVLSQVASNMKNMTATDLVNTTALTATLNTSMKSALDTVKADTANSNITIANTQAVADSVVTSTLIATVATAIGSTSTTGAVAEATLINTAAVTAINTASTTASTTASSQVTVTAKPNHPPVMSGTPAVFAYVGKSYSFTPTARDIDGNTLTFMITNKPAWAAFNAATGQLSGNPTAANVGTTTGIVISVTDGIAVTALPAFTLTAALTGT